MGKHETLQDLQNIGTVWDEIGRSYLYIPDDLWKMAVAMDYIEGIPLLQKRQ